MRSVSISILALALMLTTLPGVAAQEPPAPNLGSASLKALGALILVVALIFVVAWLTRRYLPRMGPFGRFLPQSPGRGDAIQVVSSRSLGPKRSVHLLVVDGRRLLVGSSESGVSLLKDFSPGCAFAEASENRD